MKAEFGYKGLITREVNEKIGMIDVDAEKAKYNLNLTRSLKITDPIRELIVNISAEENLAQSLQKIRERLTRIK